MISKYIDYIRAIRGYSAGTCEEYEKNLREFAKWASPKGLRWSTLKKQDVDEFTREQSEKGLKPRTIHTKLSAIRSLLWWMVSEGMISENPAKWCSAPKIGKTIPKPACLEQIDAYLNSPAQDYEDGTIHILTALLLESGLRISEALNVRKGDFINDHTLKVVGKGKKERIVYFGERTRAMIRKYRTVRTEQLFPDMTAEAARYAMYRTLGTYCPYVHPHQLRATFACESLNAGMPIHCLQALLGHESVTTTEVYAKAMPKQLEAEYQKCQF